MPDFDDPVIDVEGFRLHRREWGVTTFDLATLATKHKLHVPYQLMDVYLNGPTNFEIEVSGSQSREEAIASLDCFRAMLYLNGVTPFIMPFIATHSLNAYAGINSRDSESLKEKLPGKLKFGINSKTATVEVWPYELSLTIYAVRTAKSVTAELAGIAARQVQKIRMLEQLHSELIAVRYALTTAPQITDLGSSLLHLWTGLESLFPKVGAEVSFRISLLIAELASPLKPAASTYKIARRSYTHRSNAAHGNLKKIGHKEWCEAWELLCISLLAVIHRGHLPDEDALINSMLARSGPFG
jgi:hypothetical protein